MATKQTKWSRAYNEKAYDRLAITIPKGKKVVLKKIAAEAGESVNEYVCKSVLNRIGKEEWKSVE